MYVGLVNLFNPVRVDLAVRGINPLAHIDEGFGLHPIVGPVDESEHVAIEVDLAILNDDDAVLLRRHGQAAALAGLANGILANAAFLGADYGE